MFRRCVSILLMMAYFAGQLAIVPHTHEKSGDSQPCGHNARPHMHISWWRHGDHSDQPAHRNRNEGDNSLSPHSSGDVPVEHDHDSDAIYLSNEIGPPTFERVTVSQDNVPQFSTLAIVDVTLPTTTLGSWPIANFADKGKPGCPLYLALRALRI